MQSAAESGAALVPTHVDVTKPSTELATIEFRVINDDDGQPRAGVTLEVRGPDGKLYRPTTGSDGRAVLTNVPDGAYEIIETREVPTLEMVRMESGPRPPR